MNKNDIMQQAVIFSRARSNLLLVIGFTIINMILRITGSNVFFLFSATMPSVVLEITYATASWGIGIAFAALIVMVYLLCWAFAKRWRWLIVVALVFFSIDTLMFFALVMPLISSMDISLIIEIGFQLWIMFYLITGTRAWARLRRVTNQDVEAAQNEAANTASRAEGQAALDELSIDEDDNSDNN